MTPAPVSVVIPVFNAQATLGRALASVRAQTLPPQEVLCIDDGSSDGSEKIAASLAQDSPTPIRWLRMPSNRGPAAARNRGMDAACSPYIAFLDADDAWHPRKLQWQLETMRQHRLDLLGGHLLFNPTATWSPASTLPPLRLRPVRLWQALMSNPYHTSAVLMRRDPAYRFSEDGQLSEDYRLWLLCIADGWRCAQQPPDLCAMFKPSYGEAGLSRNLLRMQQGEMAALRHIGAHGHPLAAALAMPWSCAKFLLRLLKTATRGTPRA